MRNYFKILLYIIVLIGYSSSNAGSYDDFFIAIKRDDAAIVLTLLQRGFDGNTRDPKGVPGLHLAMLEPSPKVVRTLIAWPQVQVDARNAHDETPLMLASLRGYTETVRLLVERDADINKPGWTPLHYAATNSHLDIMRLLIERHAYIDAEAPNGNTPLMMAAVYGNASAVKLLLEAGADPLLKNKAGLTAIELAQRMSRNEAVELIAAFARAKAPRGSW